MVDWGRVADELAQCLEPRRVVRRREELLVYECDGLASYRQRPRLVVLPKTTAEVQAAVQICRRYGIPFVPRGAGTGLSGGALPEENSVLIVTAMMRQILEVDVPNRRVVVQPGVINTWVTQAVSGKGFYYAPDPSSQTVCSVGGNVAENSGGVHCLKYGVTTNHVLGLTLVTGLGEVVELGGRVPEMPGYDLTGVVVGSEGTLGIVTEITLNILKAPEVVQVLCADFPTVAQAGAAVSAIIAAGITPGGMEIMDNLSINAVENVVATGCYPRDAGAILLVEVDGLPGEVAEAMAAVQTLCKQQGARGIQIASDPQERYRLWQGRKAAFAAMGKMSRDYYVQDGVVPRSQLPRILQAIERLSQASGYRIANVFHAGDGNLHPLILFDESVPGALAAVERLGGEILKLCIQAGGTISGEHGVGAEKRCYMSDLFSPVDLETMQLLRRA
ncbi:MAG: FAD-linked oxidase C-terminal domain-containing protein, partial [Gloeomargarita sp. DG_1_6_bins_138]